MRKILLAAAVVAAAVGSALCLDDGGSGEAYRQMDVLSNMVMFNGNCSLIEVNNGEVVRIPPNTSCTNMVVREGGMAYVSGAIYIEVDVLIEGTLTHEVTDDIELALFLYAGRSVTVTTTGVISATRKSLYSAILSEDSSAPVPYPERASYGGLGAPLDMYCQSIGPQGGYTGESGNPTYCTNPTYGSFQVPNRLGCAGARYNVAPPPSPTPTPGSEGPPASASLESSEGSVWEKVQESDQESGEHSAEEVLAPSPSPSPTPTPLPEPKDITPAGGFILIETTALHVDGSIQANGGSYSSGGSILISFVENVFEADFGNITGTGIIEASNRDPDGGSGGRVAIYGVNFISTSLVIRTYGGGLSGVGTIYIAENARIDDGFNTGSLNVAQNCSDSTPIYETTLPPGNYFVQSTDVARTTLGFSDKTSTLTSFGFCLTTCDGSYANGDQFMCGVVPAPPTPTPSPEPSPSPAPSPVRDDGSPDLPVLLLIIVVLSLIVLLAFFLIVVLGRRVHSEVRQRRRRRKEAFDREEGERQSLVQYLGVTGDRYPAGPGPGGELDEESATGDASDVSRTADEPVGGERDIVRESTIRSPHGMSYPDKSPHSGTSAGKGTAVLSGSTSERKAKASSKFNEMLDFWEIDFKDLAIIHPPIAQGGSSVVSRAMYHDTIVAVKMYFDSATSDPRKNMEKEVIMLTKLHHPNIVLFMGACREPLCIVTEYAGRGSLFEIIRKNPRLLIPPVIKKVSIDTIRGLIYLHTRKPSILHRDLKSMNILITNDWIAKIADFGLSKSMQVHKSETSSNTTGTVGWVAPEVLSNLQFSFKSDVYSFGMVVWEMWSKNIPYQDLQFRNRVEEAILHGERPVIPSETPERWRVVIEKCWAHNPADRPSLREVLKVLKEDGSASTSSVARKE
mmetsp:Transcript_17882/g.50362  ORF Transcript_17882/g.50362 Transcript_17882/m.50362 type:complete len:909 (+) Transcript_17882:122-2848(+)